MTKKMRWVLPIALLGAVGCSEAKLPHVGMAGEAKSVETKRERDKRLFASARSNFERICLQFPGIDELPVSRVDEYAPLIAYVKALSPLLASEPDRFTRAHVRALEQVNEDVAMLLFQNGQRRELRKFEDHIHQFVSYARPRVDTDLLTMLDKVMVLSEGSACGSAYLSHFYSLFIQNLDPMGNLVLGLNEKRAADNTLAGYPLSDAPEVIRRAPLLNAVGPVEVVSLRRFLRSQPLEAVLHTLETGFAAQSYKGILFDLRFAGGDDLAALGEIWASLRRGWGNVPIVLWTNRETSGVPAVMAKQFSSHPNVQVISLDQETYGWGRKLAQQSTTLIAGTKPLIVSVGSELLPLSLPDGTGDSDGYRLHDVLKTDTLGYRDQCGRLAHERHRSSSDSADLANDCFSIAMDKAQQWAGQAQPGDMAQPQPEPSNTPAAAQAGQDPQAQVDGSQAVPSQDQQGFANPLGDPQQQQGGVAPQDGSQPQDPNTAQPPQPAPAPAPPSGAF